MVSVPVPVAVQSKAVFGCSIIGIAFSNPAEGKKFDLLLGALTKLQKRSLLSS